MKLVASMMVGPNEQGRYLAAAIESLAEFCDEIRIRLEGYGDEGDGWFHGNAGSCPVAIRRAASSFFEHEGRARQELLDWTLAGEPTHILAIDADEFVADGPELRSVVEDFSSYPVIQCCIVEVWNARPGGLEMRVDGGWDPHPVPTVYRVPDTIGPRFRIQDRALACGREPMEVRQLNRRHGVFSGVDLLHFGWTNVAERIARHERYAVADGGKYHANQHLQSILWPDAQCTLEQCGAPAALTVWSEIVRRANRARAAG